MSLSRNGTRMAGSALIWPLGLLGLALSPAVAQAQSEDDGPVAIACQDGSQLQALFGEKDVTITLESGETVKLVEKPSTEGFLYTSGKQQLKGDDSKIEWIVGRKAPVICEIADGGGYQFFDEPLAIDTKQLPADPANPDAEPQVNCFRFPGFMVKEVDLGEKGAQKLALAAAKAACEKDDKDDRVLTGDSLGYFLGTKGKFVFFQAPDGWNGGMPFEVYDSVSGKSLFADSFEGTDFAAIDVAGDVLTLKFRRTLAAACTLTAANKDCAAEIIKEGGFGPDVKLPDCTAAYDAEIKRSPDYAKEIAELPSIISYDAQLVYDGTKATITPLAGEMTCRVPE